MTTASQFGGGSAPVGSFIQVAYALNDPAYLLANGAKILRSAYPLFSSTQLGVNTFTYTARTKGVTSASTAIAVHAGLWVMAGAKTTTVNIQTTPDAVTFTQRSTPATLVNCDVRSLISDGINVVGVAVNVTGIDAFYSADAITFTRSSGTVNCLDFSNPCVMAYSSTLGTLGRFIVANGTTGFYTSDDRGVTWTTQAHGLTGNVFSVAWTGAKFIALTSVLNTIFTSTTGLAGSWVSQTLLTVLLVQAAASTNTIASDGAGRVCIANAGNPNAPTPTSVLVSQDHGVTWSERAFLDPKLASLSYIFPTQVSFTNGLFFITATGNNDSGQVLTSKDGIAWVILPDINLSRLSAGSSSISYKSGVYLAATFSASVITFTEDTTKMYLPLVGQATPASPSNTGLLSSVANTNTVTYVKVA